MKNALFLALLAVSVASHAAVAPKSTRYDRQVQTVLYNPDDVVRVKIGTGAATLIQFEAGENLKAPASGLGIGDPDAWDLAIRENNLFLRPKAPQPDTNISLVTNRRTYVLKLETSEQPTWLLRFTYPVEPRSPFNNNPLPCRSTEILDQAWLARGDSGLLPVHVWADGRFTCMKFYGGQELPVVYRVMPSTKAPERGTETLVNQHMQDDVMVIKETGDYFRLRMGDRVAGVSTTTLQRAGYNASGTTTGQQSSKKMIAIGIVVAVIIAACILLPVLLSGRGKDKEPEPERKNETLVKKESNDVSIAAFQRQVAQEETARKKRQADEEAEAARKKAEEERKRKKMEESQKRLDEMNKKLYGNPPPPPQNTPSGASSGSGNQKEMTPEQRKLTGHVLFDYNYESHADNTASHQGTMNTMLSGEQYADSAAGIIRFNPDYLLSGGTVLPCLLRTHIITSYPGIVLCQLTKDIYSQNGKTLLLRSGSTFFGEQKQVMLNGQARIFLNWNSVDTPEHVRVRIDALGTDTLGASGAPAWVDSHIWERLRESLMLSLFRDSLDILKNKTSEHNNDVVYDNTSNNVEDIATQAFKRSADIAATGYVAQGTLMNILVPRDLDFSTVFVNH